MVFFQDKLISLEKISQGFKYCKKFLTEFSETRSFIQLKLGKIKTNLRIFSHFLVNSKNAFKNSNIIMKDYFERRKIIIHEKNLKHRKIILFLHFIVAPIFFLVDSYQI